MYTTFVSAVDLDGPAKLFVAVVNFIGILLAMCVNEAIENAAAHNRVVRNVDEQVIREHMH